MMHIVHKSCHCNITNYIKLPLVLKDIEEQLLMIHLSNILSLNDIIIITNEDKKWCHIMYMSVYLQNRNDEVHGLNVLYIIPSVIRLSLLHKIVINYLR